jgi:hypothetical protein
MRFVDEGLVLGAGTILAHADPLSRNISIDRDGARLLALLSAAHLRLPPAHSLRHIAEAIERWREGEDALAAIHLALSGVDRIESVGSRRLDLADALLAHGCTPETIVKALDISLSGREDLAKYDPQQPRVTYEPEE